MSLTDFLLARIAEDEALWQLAAGADLAVVAGPGRLKAVPPTDFSRRMLAECAAKRAIVERAALANEGNDRLCLGDTVLTELAAIYADHDDYRDEWKP